MCSLLKVILLQSSEVSDSVTETKPVDFISLSGVCLMNNRGTWRIQVQTTRVFTLIRNDQSYIKYTLVIVF